MLILSFYGENVKDKRGFVAYIAKTDDSGTASMKYGNVRDEGRGKREQGTGMAREQDAEL
jgi:hypothetical protein